MSIKTQGDGYDGTCPNLEDVHIALVVLHHHPDRMEKKGASAWLTKIQSSVHAWDLSVCLLQENRDLESSFFGAQTIRLKIQRSHHELPAEHLLQIRNKLLVYLKSVDVHSNGIVVRRLCLAVADLAFKLTAWTNPIEDLINEFSSYNIIPLMEILKAIPEEALATPMDPSHRMEVTEYLQRSSGTISMLLDGILTHFKGHAVVDVAALRCLMSWVPVHLLPDLVKTNACDYAFQIMTSSTVPDETHEAACMVISALLDCLIATIVMSQIGGWLLSKVKMFQEPYHLAVAHEDNHKVLRYSRLFTEVAECFLPEIIGASSSGQPHYSMEVFDLVLQCVGHHDYEVADRTFDVWFTLSDEINDEKERNPGIIVSFRPYIERLIIALCNNLQMEPDQASLLEDGDEFQDFRTRAFELVKEVVFIVGAKHTFDKFMQELLRPGSSWESYEAVLFMLCAIGSKVEGFDEAEMHKIFETILKFNADNSHVAIRNTVLQLIGELTHLITVKDEYIEFAINLIITTINDPVLAPQASVSLGTMCLWSPNNMSKHLNKLFPLTTSLDSYPLTNNAAVQLLLAISSVLKVLKPPLLEVALRHFCWPQITRLNDLIVGNVGITIGTRTDPVICCDRLTVIFHCALPSEYVDGNHPFLPVFAEIIMPILLAACNKYKADMRIMKRCFKTIRFGIRAMGRQSTELLEPVQQTLLSVFAEYHYKCVCKTACMLFEQYVDHPACIDQLHNLLQRMAEPTINRLRLGHDHFVEDVFEVIRYFVRRSPTYFLQRQFTEQIIQGGIIALTLNPLDSSAKSVVLKFFSDIMDAAMTNQNAVDYFLRRQLVEQLIEKYGKGILMALWCVIVEERSLIMEVSHFIFVLRNYNEVLATRYLKAAVESLPSLFADETMPLSSSEATLYSLFKDIMSVATLEEMSELLDRISQAFMHKTRVQRPIFN